MKKYLIIFIAIIILLIPAIWFGGRWILLFSTADYEGEIKLAGVRDSIEITFDERGIPQVWASNDADLYFAFGWLHASERLFQMELVRRFAAGELSEIFGQVAYPVDFGQRRMGFARKAKEDFASLEPDVRALLQSYCDGINAWIDYKSILPPEFVLLRLSPREWEPLDCLTIALYQTWYAHSLMDKDYQYYQLIENFGQEIQRLLIETKNWSPPTVHNSFAESYVGFHLNPPQMTLASNSWAISPEKSASGSAIHASDPHLMINQIPGFWYIVGLHSEQGFDALGVTVPGLPFVAMGHTGRIAYGFTVASVDLVDYYVQPRHSEDSLQVLAAAGYERMGAVQEEIRVKDFEQPRVETFYYTSNGVVVESDPDQVVTLRWAGFDFNAADILNHGMKLPTVDNFQDFRRTVTNLGALDVNWTYSDIDGNIGYQLGSPVPRRDYENTFDRLDAADVANQWRGYYPLNQTPHLQNPVEGWLASCNNQIVSERWFYELPGFYDPYRIVRISELLGRNMRFTRSQMAKMQLDWVSVAARRWKSLMRDGALELEMNDLTERIDLWDGVMFKHGRLPALFALWWEFLAHPIFYDDLRDNWRLGQIIQEEVLTNNLQTIIDNLDTPGVQETAVDVSAIALDSALSHLDDRVYEDICQLYITHPLSQVKWLDHWLNLNRGPFGMGGDFASLNANLTLYEQAERRFNTLVGPSMRFVLNWAEIDSFSIILNLGQSGNPFSPHYDDFFDLWRNGEEWIVPFTREKVYKNRKSLLRLVPK